MIGLDIRFMRHELVHDALALGWMVAIPAFLACHDAHSVPVVWLCGCPPAVPRGIG